jgi:hypothetical protein
MINKAQAERILYMVEGHKRTAKLEEIWDDLTPEARTAGVLQTWSSDSAPINHYDFWEEALSFYGILTDDPKALAALSDELTIYRGSASPDAVVCGFSWTLDRAIGEKFARLTTISIGSSTMLPRKEPGMLAAMTIRKQDISMYLTGREESEVVLHPDEWPNPEDITLLERVEP